eukprot:TRINITY_DN20245_c0_g1_i1.p1 TRINITY_DN20245_c0_g1~~TRINITY_DN20245_c0_g1_i1.p1  ORF type:complete len:376 (+),score=124.24 TRINITY_DN20245_c0_g1_i1:73-1128(+)
MPSMGVKREAPRSTPKSKTAKTPGTAKKTPKTTPGKATPKKPHTKATGEAGMQAALERKLSCMVPRFAQEYKQIPPELIHMMCEQLGGDEGQIQKALIEMAADIPSKAAPVTPGHAKKHATPVKETPTPGRRASFIVPDDASSEADTQQLSTVGPTEPSEASPLSTPMPAPPVSRWRSGGGKFGRKSLREICAEPLFSPQMMNQLKDSDSEEEERERQRRKDRVRQRSLMQHCRRLSTVKETEGPFGSTVLIGKDEPEPEPAEDRAAPAPPAAASPSASTASLPAACTSSASLSMSQGPADECIVCMEPGRSVLILPCRHLCLCKGCAELEMSECPLCRKPIESKMEIFMA